MLNNVTYILWFYFALHDGQLVLIWKYTVAFNSFIWFKFFLYIWHIWNIQGIVDSSSIVVSIIILAHSLMLW